MARFKRFGNIKLRIGFVSVLLLSGCASVPYGGDSNPPDGSNLRKFEVQAGRHVLTGWRRDSMQAPADVVKLYIEGDGRAWIRRSQASPDPTPRNPMALKLAAADPDVDVIYLARPCQFTPMDAPGNDCTKADWTSERYSAAIIAGYMQALDKLKAQFGIRGFHVIGYSGGANIAGLLAGRREDILSLRTVAGNVDNAAFTALHDVSAMPQSLNMADYGGGLALLPQVHFVGARDDIVPRQVVESYITRVKPLCARVQMVEGADHGHGWAEAWPALLTQGLSCS